MFYLRNSISSSLSWWGSWDPSWKNFSGSSPITTFTKSSYFASSVDLSMGEAEDFNCYNPFSLQTEGSASGLCWMATTMHCLVITWSPNISSIWPWDEYLTFYCKVVETALKVWSQVLATIVVYGEYVSTTIKSTSTTSEPVCTGNLSWPFGITIFHSKLTKGKL